jgi:hypothetical protein
MNLRLCACIAVAISGIMPMAAASQASKKHSQRFACEQGLSSERCHSAVVILNRALEKYSVGELGEWRWIIVPSAEWKKELALRGIDVRSPALTYLRRNETFFDEALFLRDSLRSTELVETWNMSIDQLLDKAVRHELAHALCREKNEARAKKLEELFRSARPLTCFSSNVLRFENRQDNARFADESKIGIPFELQYGFLVVIQARVGRQSGLRFVLDTGATRSVIDRRLANSLSSVVQTSKRFEVFSFDQRLEFDATTIDGIEIGPIRAAKPLVLVTELGAYSELAQSADGVVGMDLLSAADKMWIDYDQRRVWFSPNAAEAKKTAHSRCFVVTIEVQGAPMRLAVDTSFEGIAIHEDRIRLRLPKLRREGESTQVRMGRLLTTELLVPDVKIGKTLETVRILVMNTPRNNEVDGIDGYLGVRALHAKLVEFDFVNGVFRWE